MLPSFEKYYLSDALADVSITLFEEADESPGKRKREAQIPAHSMVLAVTSSYCEAKLTHWSNPRSGGVRYSIELPVPKGQLHVGELLVQGMYSDSNSYMQGLDQKQLLELLTLADRYGVPKVQQAVLHALTNVAVADLQWDTAVALLDLPISCRALESYHRVDEVAGAKVHMRLGCLETVWRGEQPELQPLLLGLPHAALLWLLQSKDTIVWSECTVVYTILQWWRQQSAEAQQLELLKQLMQQVCLQHCSQLYILTVLMNDQLIRQCFTLDEWSTAISASVCQRVDIGNASSGPAPPQRLKSKHLQEVLPETFKQYPAWSAEPRSCNATQYVSPPTEYWTLDVSELQPAAEQIFAGNLAGGSINGPKRVFCGQPVQFKAKLHVIKLQHPISGGPHLSEHALDPTPVLCIGLHVEVLELSPGAVRSFDDLSFHCESGTMENFDCTWQVGGTPQCVTSMANTYGVDDFITVGPVEHLTSWPMVEIALKESHVLWEIDDKLTLNLIVHLDIS